MCLICQTQEQVAHSRQQPGPRPRQHSSQAKSLQENSMAAETARHLSCTSTISTLQRPQTLEQRFRSTLFLRGKLATSQLTIPPVHPVSLSCPRVCSRISPTPRTTLLPMCPQITASPQCFWVHATSCCRVEHLSPLCVTLVATAFRLIKTLIPSRVVMVLIPVPVIKQCSRQT